MDEQILAVQKKILASRHVIIASHERPDGDAIGSALGLRRILAATGRRARVVGLRPYADRYAFLEQEGEIEDPHGEWFHDADLFIALDSSNVERLSPLLRPVLNSLPLINIDHHPDNAMFGDINWVMPQASSTGEMMIRLARASQWAIGKDAAEALWVAIVTDTGRFSYENTTAEVLRMAADLVDQGVQPAIAERHLYQSIQVKEYQLIARVLERLTLHAHGRLATLALSREDFREFDCSPQNAQDLVNLGRNIQGVEVTLFFYELLEEPKTKVSVRTQPPHDASQLCRIYGGGGHTRAAGCSLDGPLSTVMPKVLTQAQILFFPELG